MKTDFSAASLPPDNLLDAALFYARHGIPVLPLDGCGAESFKKSKGRWEPSKEPDGELAPHGSKDATTDEATIRRWWTRKPNANIGLATFNGKVKIAVIDVDVPHDGKTEDGFRSLRESGLELPATWWIGRTQSGGHHYFYKWTQGDPPKQTQSNIRNANGDKVLGVDVRGTNGYIVAYPSKVKCHDWPEARSYECECFDIDALGEFPEWAKNVGAKKKECQQPTLPCATNHADDGDALFSMGNPPELAAGTVKQIKDAQTKRTSHGTRHGRDDLDRRKVRAAAYLATIPPAIEGQGGHGALLHAMTACAVWFDLPNADALEIMWRDYNPRCSPPWDRSDKDERDEFERKLDQAWEKNGAERGKCLTESANGSGATSSPQTVEVGHDADEDDGEDNHDGNVPSMDWNEAVKNTPGLIGDIARYALSTMPCPNPMIAFAGALVTGASLYNRQVIDSSGMFANIFALAVVPSGGGKDAFYKMPERIISAAYKKCGFYSDQFMGTAHSASAIVDALSQNPVITMSVDEASGWFGQSRNGAKNGASIATIREALKVLYSIKYGDPPYRGGKNARLNGKTTKVIAVNNPCLSFAGATQEDMIVKAFEEADIKSGLLGRFIIFESPEYIEPNYDAFDDVSPLTIPDEILAPIADYLKGRCWTLTNPNDPRTLRYSDEYTPEIICKEESAKAMFKDFAKYCEGRLREAESDDRLTAPVWRRGCENAKRIATIITAGTGYNNPSAAKVGEDIAALSTNVALDCLQGAIRLFESHILDEKFDQIKSKVLRFICKGRNHERTKVEITRGHLGDSFNRTKALDDLVAAKFIARFAGSGEFYRATKAGIKAVFG